MKIFGIPADRFEKAFPLVEWHFQSFAERSRGEATVGTLRAQVLSEYSQCWIVWDGKVKACALTKFETNQMKVVEITHCAGEDRGQWRDALVEHIEVWGRSLGAERLRVICRPGWARELKGLKETHRVMEKDIGR